VNGGVCRLGGLGRRPWDRQEGGWCGQNGRRALPRLVVGFVAGAKKHEGVLRYNEGRERDDWGEELVREGKEGSGQRGTAILG